VREIVIAAILRADLIGAQGRALLMAFDRRLCVTYSTEGGETPADSRVPPAMLEPTVSYRMPQAAAAERRAEERHTCKRWASCTVSGSGESHCCRLHDFSQNSLGLMMNSALRPDSSVFVSIPPKAELPRGQLIARVVHASPQTDGTWLVGCQLYDPLTNLEFEALLRSWD
jgi:hypothetical protein